MRRVVVLLLLLVPAARAQSNPADTALVARTIDAIRPRMQMEALRVELAGLPGGGLDADLDSLEADFRARLARSLSADFPPTRLREAISFLESDACRRTFDLTATAKTPEARAALWQTLSDAPPSAFADSALTARFVGATQAYEAFTQGRRRTLLALMTEVPHFIAMRTAEGLSAEEAVEAGMSEQEDALQEGFMIGASYQLQRLNPADAALLIAYGESAAGRYVTRVLNETVIKTMIPQILRWAHRVFSYTLDGPTSSDIGESLPESGVYLDEEDEPVLIGGLEGLAAQIVYPESARRASVEGTVYVEFVVDETGVVVDPVVMDSPDATLSEEALRVVRSARFEPGRVHGELVKVRYVLPVRFALRDDDAPGSSDDD